MIHYAEFQREYLHALDGWKRCDREVSLSLLSLTQFLKVRRQVHSVLLVPPLVSIVIDYILSVGALLHLQFPIGTS